MKLQSQSGHGQNAITAYGKGQISVNGNPLTTSFIVTPSTLVTEWPPQSIDTLSEADIEAIAALNCKIILLGTGLRQRFPAAALLRPLIQRQIGVEVMDSLAACRTYNILMAEGREVAAAIILEATE
jgi:uncharacterized protein